MVKQVSRSSGISSGFRVFVIFSATLALISSAKAGSGQLTSNPSAVKLGSVPVGSSQTQSLTLTNVGSSSLIITQATPSLAAFTLTGLYYPVTLYAGKSVSCNVTFSPQSGVTSSGSITIKFHNRHNTSARYQAQGSPRVRSPQPRPVSASVALRWGASSLCHKR